MVEEKQGLTYFAPPPGEIGLKLVRMETDIATHICKLLLRKIPNTEISMLFCEIKF